MITVERVLFGIGLVASLIVGGLVCGGFKTGRAAQPAAERGDKIVEQEQEHEHEAHTAKTAVTVSRPKQGSLERLTTQPGSIQAYESVRLYAKVPGFLKWQRVESGPGVSRPLDIGDQVAKGQKLAVVDVPELESQVRRNLAGLKQARAKVDQMTARVKCAVADLDAARAAVTRAEASAKSAAAWVRYRALQLNRMTALVSARSIEQKLEDEAKEHYEASVETELGAKETITASRANVVATTARIDQARADVEEAQAEVDVAQADLEKAQVQLAFATISAPFNGVVTQRTFFEGDYIRSANEGSNEPMLTIERTDLMRVIVQIPDRDVPFVDPGDPAFVQIDALPGRKLPAKVSRIARYEDSQTRLMRVEIDLPNPTGKICHGMYGQVTIVLDQEKNLISIPSSCVVQKQDDAKGIVYVVRAGHARQVAVRLGTDNGLRVAILGGLTTDDEVIVSPEHSITDGCEVTAKSVD